MRTTTAFLIFPCLAFWICAVNGQQQGSVGDLPPLPDLPTQEPSIERVPVLPVEPTPPKVEAPKPPTGYKVISSSEAYSLVPDEEKNTVQREVQPEEKSSWESSENTAPTQQQWSPRHSWSSTKGQPTYQPVSSKNPIGPTQSSKNPISVSSSKNSSFNSDLALAQPSFESPVKKQKKFNLGKLLRYKKASSYRYRGRLGSTMSIRYPNVKAKQN